MSRELEVVEAPTEATIYYNGNKETVWFSWSQEQPVGMVLPALLEIITEMEDVIPIIVMMFLKRQAKDPLCLSVREKVGDVKSFFDVNPNIILVRTAPLDGALQWYVLESLPTSVLVALHLICRSPWYY